MLNNEKLQNIMKLAKALLLIFAVLVVLAVIVVAIINLHVKAKTSDRVYVVSTVPRDNYDAALVLGCGVYNNEYPSPLLRERLDAAVELFHEGVVNKLIMSGDHGQDNYNEVAVMKQYAIDEGVPSEAIFMDHAGFSTYESVFRARDIFMADSVLIVSQEYHVYRALYVAEALGLEAYAVSADKTRLSGQTARDLREILARNKDFIFSIIKPEPTYLGEPISLDQSGDITND
ncbi:MAG: ElyC/SanA/YdcF family protein [Eubacteriales bacterium]|nr:ElyC/SanA/YdcF family protein [Eubacteriales bacterium]MDD4683404.1 ElyC/SanA/YdcF family protein [Eubacteriales bacterium]